jgi:hypothetical protein
MLPQNGPETASSVIKFLQDARLLFPGQNLARRGSRSDLIKNNQKEQHGLLEKTKQKYVMNQPEEEV